MSLFTKFNRKNIDDRQIDTLIGLSKGIAADGKVGQTEAEVLLNWLAQSRQVSDNPIIVNLFQRVREMLVDEYLDPDESAELLSLLQKINGEPSELGEIAKPSTLPLCSPVPEVSFVGRSFLFTGTCAFGARNKCHAATEELGGLIAKNVTKSVNYLVLGSYVTDSWAHETFGRKIEKAMQYRSAGVPIAIINEEHWADSGNITV
ncbi:NAD-dependent DNA ligase [bacterium]|nr:NAD-dependent DNA ligase [bacterium]